MTLKASTVTVGCSASFLATAGLSCYIYLRIFVLFTSFQLRL